MAQVDGLSKTRMLAMEAETIVGGTVVGDHLILQRRDGGDVDAGDVRGPSAPTDTASTPDTIVLRDAEGDVAVRDANASGTATVGKLRITGTNDASATSTAHPFQVGPDSGQNLIIDGNEIQARDNGVGKRVFFEYGANTDTALYSPSAVGDFTHKKYVDDLVKGQEIPGGVDLNGYTNSGIYWQSQTSEAISGVNYPEQIAGLLEVMANGSGATMIWQRYTPYGSFSDHYYMRSWFSATWSAWKRFDPRSDTGWIPVTGFISGWASDTASGAVPLAYRIINGVECWWRGRVTTPSLSPNTTYNFITSLPSAVLPPMSNNSHAVFTTGGFVFWANVSSAGTFGVHAKSPWVAATAVIDFSGVKYLLG